MRITWYLLIQVGTEKDDLDHNTFVEFDVHAYKSPSRTFLYIRAIRVSFPLYLRFMSFLDPNSCPILFIQ